MSFSFVVIPDTQIMAKHHPESFAAMTRWIAEQAGPLRIRAVLHLGDVVDSGARSEREWELARNALGLIERRGIPLLIAPGNHDYDNLLANDRSLTMFNRFFGAHRYAGAEWFGGSFEEDRAENVYARLNVDGTPFLVLALEFGPRDEVLAWADDVLRRYPDHRAIVVTHCHMYIHGERSKPGDAHNPKTYPGAHGANDGEDLWQKCFRKHGNLIAVYSGHQVPAHVSYRIDRGDEGNLVFQSFQNWQEAPNGGDGRIRIVRFDIEGGTIGHSVFNPRTNRYETEDGFEVDIPFSETQQLSGRDWTTLRHPRL
ncbi:metallophosphoesterase [Paenibacillus sp. GYB003]|uniref:metallophosphoesterase n=1 Tax=Paenibacillus sp. GYB003 TaxID=2994392 RepID=UPI002F963EBA